MLSSYVVNDFNCANKESNSWNIFANIFFSFKDRVGITSGFSAETRSAASAFLKAGSTSFHSAISASFVPPAEYNLTALSTASLKRTGAWNVTICPYVLFLSKIRFVLENAWIRSCGPIGCLSIKIVDIHGASNPVSKRSTTITKSNCSFLLLYLDSFLARRLFKFPLYPCIWDNSYVMPNIPL